jgi:hypothetical protein
VAHATTKSGSVNGKNTIDIHEFRGFKDDDVINFQVNAIGQIKNILTIKIQKTGCQQYAGLEDAIYS